MTNYQSRGFGITSSKGVVAVLNDLGGSINAASSHGVEGALVALDNVMIVNSDTSPNTSAYSWNPGVTSV